MPKEYSPASVSEIGLGLPGRSTRRSPTMRSSVAICCDIADCVAQALGGLPEGALVGDRLERSNGQVEPEPTISFHDRMLPSEQYR